ncbi:peptidase M1 family aminopeptidase (macronuclear) [Tetrahymena thermophila SB210]|uniref:Peptidase M1 family aminopeptidase n=1 Tax=Tetrahymena thermophila (strain SB210) TaxID=312017 RepID=I7LWU2_TETTS|nr:peptidase M1 family aminopeptidase [Tetrahymena thermophila SB210]EAS02858.2 peptidase M1 family aminopeptidase [Tetrahymena thermophila SB210]|eukprot:XP_001023103.2 peptidase M1 family aminopeptidase [Tetrahymena thermophila SB210]
MCITHKEVADRIIQCLTEKQAQLRSSIVLAGSVNYHLRIKLLKGPNYQGLITVRFFALKHTDEVFLDFTGKTILGMSINNNQVENIDWDGNFLKLKGVKQGRNEILVHYENKYDNDGNGLHSFIDEDKKQYIYTNLAVIYCRRVFPCFDQPDLKGSFQLTAISPKDWIVLSNEIPSEKLDVSTHFNQKETIYSLEFIKQIIEDNSSYDLREFPESKPLASYLFGIMAGPYAEVKCKQTYKNIPMSLFTRESIMPHLLRISDFLFEVTNKSMEVYERIFGYDFPFNKYDQIYVPEFNWGAMENAGIVTFNDLYVYREEVDSVKLTKLANTTSHELSHHWFGNLVTMKWWNDVWLNESFADFISHYCLSQFQTTTRPMSDIWVAFNARKAWGYRTDEQVTTHPIAGSVPDTNTAENVFDGITYAKGAATLRQLFSLVSVENFSKAMKEYFHKFEWRSATLSDLINTVDEQFQQSGSSFSLSSWQKTWICKAGLNKCIPLFDPSSRDVNSKLVIKQTYTLEMHPTLRNHKMKIAFFDENAKIVHQQDILLQDQPETVITYDGSKGNYKALLLNYQDETFIKIAFDSHSIQFFKENLNKVDCELSRTLIWQAFYNMVRDGDLSSEEYIELFINHINLEKSDGLISNQLQFLETAFLSFTPGKYSKILGNKIFDFLWSMIEGSDDSQVNKKLALIGYLPSFAKSEEKVRKLLEWYNRKALTKETMGIKTQWQIVQAVYRIKDISKEEKEELFQTQSQKDKSDQVPLYEQYCKSLLASPEEKEKLWQSYLDPNNPLSTRLLEYSLMGFKSHSTTELTQKYQLLWLQNLSYVFKTCKRELFKAYVLYLQPSQETLDEEFNNSLLKIKSEITEDVLHKVLLECQDNNSRKQKAISTFLANTKLTV